MAYQSINNSPDSIVVFRSCDVVAVIFVAVHSSRISTPPHATTYPPIRAPSTSRLGVPQLSNLNNSLSKWSTIQTTHFPNKAFSLDSTPLTPGKEQGVVTAVHTVDTGKWIEIHYENEECRSIRFSFSITLSRISMLETAYPRCEEEAGYFLLFPFSGFLSTLAAKLSFSIRAARQQTVL